MQFLILFDLYNSKKCWKYFLILILAYSVSILLFPNNLSDYITLYNQVFLGYGENLSFFELSLHLMEIFLFVYILAINYYQNINKSFYNLFFRLSKNRWFIIKILSQNLIIIIGLLIKFFLLICLLLLKNITIDAIVFLYIIKNLLYMFIFSNLVLILINTLYSNKVLLLLSIFGFLYFCYYKMLPIGELFIVTIILLVINILIFRKYYPMIFERKE